MKIRSKANGREKVVTNEDWQKIKDNGFEREFEVLDEKHPPAEVKEKMKPTSEVVGKSEQ